MNKYVMAVIMFFGVLSPSSALEVLEARVSQGKVIIAGYRAQPNTPVTLVGDPKAYKSDSRGRFRILTAFLPANCLAELKNGAASEVAVLSRCGPAGPAGPPGRDGRDGRDGIAASNGPLVISLEGKLVLYTTAYWAGGTQSQRFTCNPQPVPFKDISGYKRYEFWAEDQNTAGRGSCGVQAPYCDSTGEACRDYAFVSGCYVRADYAQLFEASRPQLTGEALTKVICKP